LQPNEGGWILFKYLWWELSKSTLKNVTITSTGLS
jgi:hypothetical protein